MNPACTAADVSTQDTDARGLTSVDGDVGVAQPRRFWWELLIVGWLYFVYDIINNLSPVSRTAALRHARDVLHLESIMGLDVEKAANKWLATREFIGSLLANFYNLAHIWITLAVIVFLWWKRRSRYADLRNALVVFNLIGFIVFWLYPVAPPRMLDGFTDVIEQTGAVSSFHSGALAPAANQFAAMPSLHVAWALWCLVAVYRTLPGRGWRIATWLHVSLTIVAVVTTANHFVLDLVGGVATALVGFAMAELFARHVRPLIVRRRIAQLAHADLS